MATSSVSRRLLRAISQVPSTRNPSRHFPCYHPPPKEWIRTITSSSTRYALETPGVSFGEENDGVIAPYIEKPSKKAKGRRKKAIELAEPVAGEDYEIGGFVDRSGSRIERSFTSTEATTQTVDEDAMAAHTGNSRRKTGKLRSGDNSSEGQQDASRYESASPRTKTAARKGTSGFPTSRRPVFPPVKQREVGAFPVRRQKSDFTRSRKYQADDTPLRRTNGNYKSIKLPPPGQPLEKKKTEGAELWAVQKNALKEKFREGWKPRKKLSPDAMEGIRGLHEQDPIKYNTELLAKEFQMSPEAIRRILKSKWLSRQSPEKMQERRERWAQRHDRIWDAQAELGLRPPRTKDREVEDPDKFEQDLERRRILGETLLR